MLFIVLLKTSKFSLKIFSSLSTEELQGLEDSLLAEGCRESLVTWQGFVIDGHNRYAICRKHDITFHTLEKSELENELDVKLWMIKNQFSRRNLSVATRLDLAFQFKSKNGRDKLWDGL